MSDHYVFGEDEDLDKLRTEMNFRKVIKKAKEIGNKSLISKKKGGKYD